MWEEASVSNSREGIDRSFHFRLIAVELHSPSRYIERWSCPEWNEFRVRIGCEIGCCSKSEWSPYSACRLGTFIELCTGIYRQRSNISLHLILGETMLRLCLSWFVDRIGMSRILECLVLKVASFISIWFYVL